MSYSFLASKFTLDMFTRGGTRRGSGGARARRGLVFREGKRDGWFNGEDFKTRRAERRIGYASRGSSRARIERDAERLVAVGGRPAQASADRPRRGSFVASKETVRADRTCSTLVSLRFSRPLTQSSSSALPTKNAGFCKPMPEAACAIVDVVRRRARRVVAATARKNHDKRSFPFFAH